VKEKSQKINVATESSFKKRNNPFQSKGFRTGKYSIRCFQFGKNEISGDSWK
jgi:hypothetical protein